jgi:hypothetical protein
VVIRKLSKTMKDVCTEAVQRLIRDYTSRGIGSVEWLNVDLLESTVEWDRPGCHEGARMAAGRTTCRVSKSLTYSLSPP